MRRQSRKYISVEVEVDATEVIDDMHTSDLAQELERRGIPLLAGGGDGDAALANNTIERAYLAAKQMANLPREVADLFWHVHGRAI